MHVEKTPFCSNLHIYTIISANIIVIIAQNIFGGEKMTGMNIANWIAFIILAIGGLNWGLVGIFNFNLVDWIFGGWNAGSIIVYVLVLLSTLWLILSLIINRNLYFLGKNRSE